MKINRTFIRGIVRGIAVGLVVVLYCVAENNNEQVNDPVVADVAEAVESEVAPVQRESTNAISDAFPQEEERSQESDIDDDTIDEIPEDHQEGTEDTEDSIQDILKPEKQKEDIVAPVQEKLEFNFENADLKSLLSYMSEAFNVTFITDDAITPMLQTGRAVGGNKITFSTEKPLSRQEAWSLFTTFLDISGLALIPGNQPKIYRIVATDQARKSAIPAFIGIDANLLPDNDTIIRYVYFIENSPVDTIRQIVDSLRSSASSLVVLQEMKAFVLTDKSYNIKFLMKIIREFDKLVIPPAMSVLKLRKADAVQVKKLYDDLVPNSAQQDQAISARLFGQRRSSTATYLPDNAQIIAEPRTNSLILLGPRDAIAKIEDFIVKNLDVDLDVPYPPLNVIQLKYADAATICDIMNNVTQFGAGSDVAKSGGVRGSDKYLKPMLFIPEVENNRVVVKGDYEDFLRAKEVVERLDEAQPQVAIDILILDVNLDELKQLGVQMRNKVPGPNGLLGNNVSFQTSGLYAGGTPKGIVENTSGSGAQRLLADLIQLVSGAPAGNTIISLGQDAFGVWGILQALETNNNIQIVSNPFLVATNKTQAQVTLGQIRRVVTGTIVGNGSDTSTNSDTSADLTVKITPQINSDGMILLDLDISIVDFKDATNFSSATKLTKVIKTKAIVADKEVLALGGLIRAAETSSWSKTPLLGDIPILGWFFKNKSQEEVKENLLILLSARIIQPERQHLDKFTRLHINEYQRTVDDMITPADKRDPVSRGYFGLPEYAPIESIDDFIFNRHTKLEAEKSSRNEVPVVPNPQFHRWPTYPDVQQPLGCEGGVIPTQARKITPMVNPVNTKTNIDVQGTVIKKRKRKWRNTHLAQSSPPAKKQAVTLADLVDQVPHKGKSA